MNKNLLALMVVLVLSTGVNAQTVGRPVAPQTAAAWASALGGYLSSPKPDITAISGFLPQLRALDMTNPEIRASVAPVTALIQRALPAIALKGEMSLQQAASQNQKPAGPELEKAWLLGTVLQDHLNAEQQRRTQAIGRAFQEAHQMKAAEIASMVGAADDWRPKPDAELLPVSGTSMAGGVHSAAKLMPSTRRFTLAGLFKSNPDKNRPKEAAFVARHGETLRAVPGVESVKAITYDVPYGENNAVVIEAAPTANIETIKEALEPYRYAGIEIQVQSRAWNVYEISSGGDSHSRHTLDPRMELGLGGEGWGLRTGIFVERHGEALRRTPGVVRVAAVEVPSWGPEYAVKVDVEPTAGMDVVKNALEPYRYAGVAIKVVSRGWDIYEITGGADSYERRALDPRMAESEIDRPAVQAPAPWNHTPTVMSVLQGVVSMLLALLVSMTPVPFFAAFAGLAIALCSESAIANFFRTAGDEMPVYAVAAIDLSLVAVLVSAVAAAWYAVGAGSIFYFGATLASGYALAAIRRSR